MVALLAFVATQGLYGPAIDPGFKVGRSLFNLGDLPISVSYPVESKGRLPVIVWSHGMYGTRTTYKPLVDALVGDGYVVIQPSHGDSLERMTPDQRRALLAHPNTNATQSWDERPGEITKCINSFATIERNIPELAGRLDVSRIGVGGHSFGAWTTQMLAGMQLRGAAKTVSMPEPRAKAFVVMSGTGPGGIVTPEGLGKMRGPMMFLTGTNDTARTGDTGEWRKRAFDLSSPGDKWLVWIDGCHHNYGGITGEKTALARQFLQRAGSSADANSKHTEIAISSVVAFFDAYVKNLPAAKGYLQAKTIEKAGGVTLSAK